MGDDGTGHGKGSGRMSFGARRRGGKRPAGAMARQASVERYLIGVRPVLINVFIDDLVEILVSSRPGRLPRRPARPSLPSRKPVRERHGAMLSSRRSCH
ncbi:hypothetical protein DF049_03810 [Burkholderia cenocepacia]|nr:hypothetical protein DF049_03810 [Burkholderia cenocepacia]